MALSVEITDLCFSYGQRSQLKSVDLEVGEGEMCCLLGPNGAGKTTLLRCLIGLLSPSAGQLRLAGVDVSGLGTREIARLVAYVPQSTTTVFPFTALDVAVMGRTPHLALVSMPSARDRRIAQATLDRLGVGHLAHRPFVRLSGGERQLVLLARALVQEAAVLVLDEPTASLDYGNEIRVLDTVRSLATNGRSVLMTTHQPNHALWWADRAAMMSGGTVIASGPSAEIITSDSLSALYDLPVALSALPLPGGRSQLTCVPDVSHNQRADKPES